MTREEEVMIDLLKRSLWEDNSQPVVEESDIDWQEVYKECRTQCIHGLVVDALPKNMDLSVKKIWSDEAKKQLVFFSKYEYQQTKLIELFKENDIPMVILKGSSAAVYYKNPSGRSMGDIDFKVLSSDFEKAKKVLLDNGFTYAHEDEQNERHTGFKKDGLIYELHKRFSYDDLDIEKYLEDALAIVEIAGGKQITAIDNAVGGEQTRSMREYDCKNTQGHEGIVTKEVLGYRFPSLPRLANGLVLLAHMRSHLKSGMGLRQLIDWNMFVYRELDDDFWKSEFMEAIGEIGLTKLALVATMVGRKYLGLPNKTFDGKSITWFENEADKIKTGTNNIGDGNSNLETTCDKLMENILSSGNFGRKQGEGNKFESVLVSIKKDGLFKRLYQSGISNWKFARKHKWARPFAPIYQVFRYMIQSIKTSRKSDVKKSLKRGQERYDLLKELEIE